MRHYIARKQEFGHGCFSETALMLGSYPETVKMDRRNALNGLSTHKTDYLDAVGLNKSTRFWSVQYPNALAATPYTGLSDRIARACVHVATEQLAAAFKERKRYQVRFRKLLASSLEKAQGQGSSGKEW